MSKYLLHQRNETKLNFVIAFSIICNIIKPDDQGALKCKFIQPTLKLEAHISQNSSSLLSKKIKYEKINHRGMTDVQWYYSSQKIKYEKYLRWTQPMDYRR